MRYRELVAIQAPTVPEVRDAAGAPVASWTTVAGLEAVACTMVPESVQLRAAQMSPTTDARRVILAGRRAEVTTLMAVLTPAGDRFEIDSIDLLVGRRQTVLHVRREAP